MDPAESLEMTAQTSSQSLTPKETPRLSARARRSATNPSTPVRRNVEDHSTQVSVQSLDQVTDALTRIGASPEPRRVKLTVSPRGRSNSAPTTSNESLSVCYDPSAFSRAPLPKIPEQKRGAYNIFTRRFFFGILVGLVSWAIFYTINYPESNGIRQAFFDLQLDNFVSRLMSSQENQAAFNSSRGVHPKLAQYLHGDLEPLIQLIKPNSTWHYDTKGVLYLDGQVMDVQGDLERAFSLFEPRCPASPLQPQLVNPAVELHTLEFDIENPIWKAFKDDPYFYNRHGPRNSFRSADQEEVNFRLQKLLGDAFDLLGMNAGQAREGMLRILGGGNGSIASLMGNGGDPSASVGPGGMTAFINMLSGNDGFQGEEQQIHQGAFRPAKAFSRKYLNGRTGMKHPVVIMPDGLGIVSTGLESWSTKPCAERYMRQRIWGTMQMARVMLLDRDCWIQHMMLNQEGMDPEGIKIRAASGMESVDYLFSVYWVWAKAFDALAYMGYDDLSLYTASYDWRLGPRELERRDKYFTRLMVNIELLKRVNGEKVVICSHSMGSSIFLYFSKWVESPKGGNGGKGWINDHIHAVMNIAGPLLGTSKGVASLLSGEVRDTAELGWLPSMLLENFLGRYDRRSLFWNWTMTPVFLPKGGDRIWGHAGTSWPDGDEHTEHLGVLNINGESYSAARVLDAYQQWGKVSEKVIADRVISRYKLGDLRDTDDDEYDEDDDRYWTNPLTMTLPDAPDMRIYCLYGVGKDTERAYLYTTDDRYGAPSQTQPMRKTPDFGTDFALVDRDQSDPSRGLQNGIFMADGDGTVPLLSLGYMCVQGWQEDRYNPGHVPITTREFKHNPDPYDFRGGVETGDHVDILGNDQLITDMLAVVTGEAERVDTMSDRIVSKIREIAARVPSD